MWLHPGRLTWNLKITQLKRKVIFQTIIFRLHVNLRGCISYFSDGWVETTNKTKIISSRISSSRYQSPSSQPSPFRSVGKMTRSLFHCYVYCMVCRSFTCWISWSPYLEYTIMILWSSFLNMAVIGYQAPPSVVSSMQPLRATGTYPSNPVAMSWFWSSFLLQTLGRYLWRLVFWVSQYWL